MPSRKKVHQCWYSLCQVCSPVDSRTDKRITKLSLLYFVGTSRFWWHFCLYCQRTRWSKFVPSYRLYYLYMHRTTVQHRNAFIRWAKGRSTSSCCHVANTLCAKTSWHSGNFFDKIVLHVVVTLLYRRKPQVCLERWLKSRELMFSQRCS